MWTFNFYVVQVDVLEDPIFKNVILLQTVLQEVRAIQLTVITGQDKITCENLFDLLFCFIIIPFFK